MIGLARMRTAWRAKPGAPLSSQSSPTRLGAREAVVRVALAATLQARLLAVRFAVELRLDAPRLAAELGFAAGLAVPGELRSFCSCSRSRRTALLSNLFESRTFLCHKD